MVRARANDEPAGLQGTAIVRTCADSLVRRLELCLRAGAAAAAAALGALTTTAGFAAFAALGALTTTAGFAAGVGFAAEAVTTVAGLATVTGLAGAGFLEAVAAPGFAAATTFWVEAEFAAARFAAAGAARGHGIRQRGSACSFFKLHYMRSRTFTCQLTHYRPQLTHQRPAHALAS